MHVWRCAPTCSRVMCFNSSSERSSAITPIDMRCDSSDTIDGALTSPPSSSLGDTAAAASSSAAGWVLLPTSSHCPAGTSSWLSCCGVLAVVAPVEGTWRVSSGPLRFSANDTRGVEFEAMGEGSVVALAVRNVAHCWSHSGRAEASWRGAVDSCRNCMRSHGPLSATFEIFVTSAREVHVSRGSSVGCVWCC
jgi:hypothetical protein